MRRGVLVQQDGRDAPGAVDGGLHEEVPRREGAPGGREGPERDHDESEAHGQDDGEAAAQELGVVAADGAACDGADLAYDCGEGGICSLGI